MASEEPQKKSTSLLCVKEAQLAPLGRFTLIAQTLFLDETGERRHTHDASQAQVCPTAPNLYTGVYFVKDPKHRRHYELTGEYGLEILLLAQFGGGGAAYTTPLASSGEIVPGEVKKLVGRARKTEIGLLCEFPGFVLAGVPEEHREAVTFTVEIVRVERAVCVRKIEARIPVDAASSAAEWLATNKEQTCGK